MALNSFIGSKTNLGMQQVYQLAKQVLVVDSSPLSLKLVADEIIDLNHIYLGSASSLEGVEEAIALHQPDLLLINCHLKGNIDGLQIAKMVKHDHEIPFYMMCASNDCESKKWSSELNPDGYIYFSKCPNALRQQIKVALS
jgi:CheY-like chemotaxis protein